MLVDLTSGIRSPPIFRLWSAITTIAGVLQRRVWTETETDPVYPNVYTALTGPPGSGKSLAVNLSREIWSHVKGLHIGPDNPTKASFLERLANSTRTFVNGADQPVIFSSIAVPCREFGNLIPKYDEFVSDLSDMYDNPTIYDSPRKTVESFLIEKPNITLCAAVAPDYLATVFPEYAWGQGITSRMMFIFSDVTEFDNTNYFSKKRRIESTSLLPDINAMYELGGEFEWTNEARATHIAWMNAGEPPKPTHAKLRHYSTRRHVHLLKLAMIAAVSSHHRHLVVTIDDYERAQEWLLAAERVMPDVFRAMSQRSDTELIDQLHFHIYQLWSRRAIAQRQPIEDEIVWDWLKDRTPSANIPKVVEAAERAGLLKRRRAINGRPTWEPRALASLRSASPPSSADIAKSKLN